MLIYSHYIYSYITIVYYKYIASLLHIHIALQIFSTYDALANHTTLYTCFREKLEHKLIGFDIMKTKKRKF